MGKPEQLIGDAQNDDSDNDDDEKQSGQTTPPPFNPSQTATQKPAQSLQRKLYRSLDDKVFGGVCSGLATYFEFNVTLVRLFVVAVALFTGVFPFVVCYMLAWMVIKPADTPRRRLEMLGLPVTPENIGRNLTLGADTISDLDKSDQNDNVLSTLGTVVNVFVKAVAAFAGIIAAAIGCGTLIAAFVCLLTSLGYAITSPQWMCDMFGLSFGDCYLNPDFSGGLVTLTSSIVLLAISLPAIAVAWAGCCVLFKARIPSKGVIITFAIIEILLIIASIILVAMSRTHVLTIEGYGI